MPLSTKTQAVIAAVVLVGSGSVALARMQLGEERSIPYQGVLEQDGVASNGTVNLRFRLFDSAADGAVVWTEEQVVDTVNGRFSAILGDGDGDVLDDDVLETPALFLEIAVIGDAGITTLSPRQEIVPVPLAARAVSAVRAASVADKSITRASLADDVRFAATITVPSPGNYVVTRQTPANWVRQIFRNSGGTPGDVFIIPQPFGDYICVSSPLLPGNDVTVEHAPFFGGAGSLRVRMQNRAGTPVDVSFSIVCELP